jgi:hypothetical protein
MGIMATADSGATGGERSGRERERDREDEKQHGREVAAPVSDEATADGELEVAGIPPGGLEGIGEDGGGPRGE